MNRSAVKCKLSSSVRLAVPVTAILIMWAGCAGFLYLINSPTISLNGGKTYVFDWSSLVYAATTMTLLAVVPWFAAHAMGLRGPNFGFAIFVITFLLVEATTWYLGEGGSRVFGFAPEVASLFEDDGGVVLLMVTNPLVSVLSGALYAGSQWFLGRMRRGLNSYS